jgi:hypothetical protein
VRCRRASDSARRGRPAASSDAIDYARRAVPAFVRSGRRDTRAGVKHVREFKALYLYRPEQLHVGFKMFTFF